MRSPRLLAIGAAVALSAFSLSSQAVITTYTSLAAWQAAISGTEVLEDFNAATVGNFSTGAFGPIGGFNGFTLSGNGNGDQVGIQNGGAQGNVNGSRFLGWGDPGNNVGPAVDVNFDKELTAFAFNWRDTDPTDAYRMTLLGSNFTNPPFDTAFNFNSSGFFGVVSDVAFSVAQFRSQQQGGFVDDFGVDNLRMVQVPEPASAALLGIGLLAFGLRRRGAA